MIAALPMYFAPQGAAQVFWEVLREKLTPMLDMDLPQSLTWPVDYETHWLDTELLLSQTCGYPLTHSLRNKVQLLGTPIYDAPGTDGFYCCSQVIKRRSDIRRELADFRGARVAYNSADSQSGYNALRAIVAPLATKGRFFGSALKTGDHLSSIDAVLTGQADVAAVDAVTWTLANQARPELRDSLQVFTKTPRYPGLPLITALETPPALLDALRTGLHTLAHDAAYAELRRPLLISGFEVTDRAHYQMCVTMQEQALHHGVREL